MKHSFWFSKLKPPLRSQAKTWVWSFFVIVVVYLVVRLFVFADFVIQASDDPTRLINTDLHTLTSYTDLIDPQLTQVLDRIYKIQTSYLSGDNIFRLHQQDIMYILTMVQTRYHNLIQYLPAQYKYLTDQLYDLSFHYDMIKTYLWSEQPKHYLVILQNTSEKRPNWGFFWSFALLTVDGWHITQFKVMDSYYPNHIDPDATVSAPAWASVFLPTLDMWFVSINKFGFTDLDGYHISQLYQKIFDKPIAGVIFVRTDIFAYIIPDFAQKIRELQFMNATVDLRRKQKLPNKKEYYLKYITEYFALHQNEIIIRIIQNLQYIASQHWIQVYLTDRPQVLESRLKKNNLTTIYNTDTIYLRDNNIAYNKLDAFVTKHAELRDSSWQLVSQTSNDYLPIGSIGTGVYDLTIYYHLNIPLSYKQHIRSLANQHHIDLTFRERHILGMTNTWDTRGMIYMPPWSTVISRQGDAYYFKTFDTDFSHNIMYKVANTRNHSSKSVTFRIQIGS